MNTFEWTIIGIITVGMVIPFWIMVVLTVVIAEQGRRKDKAKKITYVHDYVQLIKAMSDEFKGGNGKFNGPTMVAYLRELKEYPQYRESTLLYLEEIAITGSGKFDEICRAELKNLETHLLGLKNE